MPSEPRRRGASSSAEGGVERNARPYILVVDDDEGFLAFVTDLLERAGLSSRRVTRGSEALAVARDQRPALVILDVKLPDLSGYEVCRSLRDEFGEDLPIFFVSGERTDAYDRTAGLLVGADDYIMKPFEADELLARIRRATARSTSRDAPPASAPPFDLTSRESEVLRLIAAGLGSHAIAQRLVISRKTVSSHVQNVLGKLGVHSRGEAVALAYRERLVDPAEVAELGAGDVETHGEAGLLDGSQPVQ